MTEHRQCADEALAAAQRNPVMSADQQFAIAQIHALLAIEQRLAELVDHLRPRSLPPPRQPLVQPGSV